MCRVLVLGAGGFVGGAIVHALAAGSTYRPVAGLRRLPGVTGTVETRLCDATDRASLDAALAGIDVVVNAVLSRPAAMIAGVETLCAAASSAGVRRLIQISSMAVYGGREGLVGEDCPMEERSAGPYGAAKIRCERIVGAWAGRASNEAIILRPGIVYGPGGEQWIGRLGRLLRARRLGDLAEAGDGFCNLIHVRDVAAAVVAGLDRPDAAGHVFNLATTAPPRWNLFLSDLAIAIGAVPVPALTRGTLSLETRLLAPPLQAAKLLAARLGWPAGAWPEPIPPSLVRLFGQQIRLDPRRADRVLGFTRTDDAAGLAEAAAWFVRKQPR